ncbi:MAG TPA: SCO family protein [Agriterribacter sp.]|nr:SCO family protein [Agriterribacter sp.]
MYKSIFGIVLILLVYAAPELQAQQAHGFSEETALYRKIAPVEIVTREGRKNIADLYTRQPLAVALIYTRCAGVCSPFLLRLAENVQRLNGAGNYKILVVSFDPADSLQDMLQMAKLFSVEESGAWTFAVTPQIDMLTRSAGFNTVKDSLTGQYDHEALLIGVNGEGYIVKKLTGLREPNDIALLIKEINGAFTPSYPLPGKASFFSCFTYDPATGKKKPALGLLLLLLPAALTFSIIAAIAFRYRNNHKLQLQ